MEKTMQRGLVITAIVILGMVVLFYMLIANSEHPTHIHFTTRQGAFKNIVYYSSNPVEIPSQHTCDGKFVEMRDDLYETHLKLWKDKYVDH